MDDIVAYIRMAPVASAIFAITIAASLKVLNSHGSAAYYMLHPYSIARGQRLFTVLTSGFIHANIPHLAFNMISFYFFAFYLEAIMVAVKGPVGHLYFALIYLGSMVLADISSIVKHKDSPGYFSLGASGAIAGTIFSFIFFAPQGRICLFFALCMPALLFAVLYLGFSWYAGRKQFDNINHEAHFWGSVAGFGFTLLIFSELLPRFLEQLRDVVRF